MKTIDRAQYKERFKKELVNANFNLRSDISDYFKSLLNNYMPYSKEAGIINIFIDNADIALKENRALCQDTGYVNVYLSLGNEVYIPFDIKELINEAVREVYEKYSLRKSLASPITRTNTGDNTPVFFDIDITNGETLSTEILLKGGGSENVSKAGFLLPTAGIDEIEGWVTDAITSAGSKACPPYLIGVCIGGTLSKAVYLSKRLLLNEIGWKSDNEEDNKIAERLINSINNLPIGFQGLRFGQTAMNVAVKTLPCHIATMPIAVSIGCNSVRQSKFDI